jgi:HlyD family secretion protein
VKRALGAVVVLAAAGALIWIAVRGNQPAEVPFARVVRETLVSTLTTNAKVEPAAYAAIRSEVDAAVERVLVERGQKVNAGAPIATLDVAQAQRDLSDAQAAIAQAEADLARYTRGGDPASLTEIDNAIRKAKLELDIARREAESLERLAAKQAATRQELDTARDRVRRLQADIEALERKRGGLLPEGGRAAVEARLQQARAAALLARQRLEQGTLKSPIAGEAYNIAVKPGAFVHPGDLVAEVGRLDRLRVILYVDEPELGRVSKGMPVTLTWDGAPGRQWTGQVTQLPTQIVPMGTRQVGEVICLIDNAEGILQPGANVNAEIRSAVAEKAVTVPKEAVRREASRTGVLLLRTQAGADSATVEWREVELGVSSVTRVEVRGGLQAGDAVALAGERQLRSGDPVTPVFPQ